MAAPQHFPKKDWDLDFRAELYKQEFFATHTWSSKRNGLVTAWKSNTTEELRELFRLKDDERPAHIGEIRQEQQTAVIIGYWYDLLKIGPISHPQTTELLHATIHLAGSVATYFKARFNRVRPWALAPDLSPPIPLPGLPAYPSGHSAQAYLMALALADLVPDKQRDDIMGRARTVAINRERAGLNYPSDTKAGEALAVGVFEILRECEGFRTTFQEAKETEWN